MSDTTDAAAQVEGIGRQLSAAAEWLELLAEAHTADAFVRRNYAEAGKVYRDGAAALAASQQARQQAEQERDELKRLVDERLELSLDALDALKQENGELRTLAKIGVWHNECRPNRHQAAQELQKSQAVIDKLADRIAELEASKAHAEAQGTTLARLREALTKAKPHCGLCKGRGWRTITYDEYGMGDPKQVPCENCARIAAALAEAEAPQEPGA